MQHHQNIITSLITNGDISRLDAAQRVVYYKHFCDKLGLDPLAQPFKILRLHNKTILYCDRSGAQQLNHLHKVSHEIKARETVNGCYVVTAQASTPDGRRTESIGAVPIEKAKGEQLCNAMMKAETKAKRRATLDLLGLGILDESEIPPRADAHDMELELVPPADGSEGIAYFPHSLYLSNKGLAKEVEHCTTEAALFTLYNDNKQRIDNVPELKQLFTERKNQLRKQAA